MISLWVRPRGGRLYGIMFFQTYLYFASGTRDRTGLRTLVSPLCCARTISLTFVGRGVVVCSGEGWFFCYSG
jgi:hypothetical protein